MAVLAGFKYECLPVFLRPMHHPEVPTASALAAVLILIPLPAQIRSRNVALIALSIGSFFINVIFLVNSLVWAGTSLNVAPVWCDIGWFISLD
jgi:pheromone a factor receptor